MGRQDFHLCWVFSRYRGGIRPKLARSSRSRSAGATQLILIGGLVALTFSVWLQGLDALGAPLSGFLDLRYWTAGAATSFGRTAAIGCIAFLLAIISVLTDGKLAKALSLIAVVGTGLGLASSGHASAASPQWVMRPMVALHGIGIAYWTGALIPLAVSLCKRSPDALTALTRFSARSPMWSRCSPWPVWCWRSFRSTIFRLCSAQPMAMSLSSRSPCLRCFFCLRQSIGGD